MLYESSTKSKKFTLPASTRDVVRHQLVQKIVEAYEGWDAEQHRLTAEARAERKARQEALVAENDAAADAQH